ncbi:leucine-rich repeat, immunoglobulin-like domain and transmembrane domain-containing protein 1-like, partial [Scleropages formosus]
FPLVLSFCPSQCTCFYHNLSDGSKARSVICNDPEISLVPANFPVDTSKLRIEKTAIKRIPSEAFNYLSNLEFLWMSFNSMSQLNVDSFRGLYSLDELRLDGNALTSFPWESLADMPNLRLLDLHNNQITSVPAEATVYIKNLTYLDLSSNKLKSPSSFVAFIDTRLRCSDPESLSGVLLSDAELRRCQVPRVHTAVARVRSTVGNNVLLRCGTIVQQEVSKEGIIWSILSVPAVSYKDSGKYICKATNFAGSADAVISLVIMDEVKSDNQTSSSKKSKGRKQMGKIAYQGKLVARNPAAITSAMPIMELLSNTDLYADVESYSILDNSTNRQTSSPAFAVGLLGKGFGNLAANTSSLQQYPERMVRSVKVIGDTDHTVSLNWKAPAAKNTTVFSVLYAIFGERDMRRINVSPGQSRITIEGLVPKTKYIACVCVKGLIPKKEQCVIFSTDEAANATGTQKLINAVVITVACVIAVPLTVIVCCGALKRRCKKLLGKNSKDIQDSYVTFETLSPGTRAKGLENQHLTRLNPEESNRLLSARSSFDSEAAAKNEIQGNEYFC